MTKWFLALVLTISGAPSFVRAADLECVHLLPLIKAFLNQHVTQKTYNANLERRVIDQFIKRVDNAKMYFLAEDVQMMRTMLANFPEQLKERNCNAIYAVQKVFVKRVKERAKHAEAFLGPKYKLDEKAELVMDPKLRDYAKTTEEANRYNELSIHFQVANFLASGMKLKEAKDQLVRRYQRSVKNLEKQKEEDTLASFLDAFANGLDPHSSFLARDTQEDFEIQMRLSLEGIGATLSSQDGYTVIEALIPGGAAFRSGQLKTQDKIISVGQGESGVLESVIDEPLRDVVRKIRGPKGSKVRLTILRKSDKVERFNVVLVRDKINLEDDAARIHYVERDVNGKKKTFGVIDLPSFYASNKKGGRSCADDVRKLLEEAQTKKVDGVVLDLSNNGGGSLDDAVRLAGLFFRLGNVVETQGSSGRETALADEDPRVQYSGPLVVLTSRLSASASEIVAGALKDYRRAVVVGGDHTFGKGTVQQVVPLPEELGALKVTMGMFFVPGGNSTQHRGVEADIPFPGLFSTDEVGEKSLDYSLPPKALKPFLSPEAYVKTGPEVWQPLENSTIAALKELSQKRVAADPEFKKILEDARKAEETRRRPVKIADVLKDKDLAKKKENPRNQAPEARKAEYLKRAEVREALNVLGDLVADVSKPPVQLVETGRVE